MSAHPEPYQAQPDTELWRLLEQVETTSLLVEKNGRRFRIVIDADESFGHYDPRKVREAIHATAGALTGVHRDELLADLRAERGQDSIGRPAE